VAWASWIGSCAYPHTQPTRGAGAREEVAILLFGKRRELIKGKILIFSGAVCECGALVFKVPKEQTRARGEGPLMLTGILSGALQALDGRDQVASSIDHARLKFGISAAKYDCFIACALDVL
jgi:hypothetical protein